MRKRRLRSSDWDALEAALRRVKAAHRIGRDEFDDFAQFVRLRALTHPEFVLACRNVRARASFIRRNVERLRIDWIRASAGHWRPSADARRLGPLAVDLERLIGRVGLTPAQAVEHLDGQIDGATRPELERLLCLIRPHRRQRTVSDPLLRDQSAGESADAVRRLRVAGGGRSAG